MCSDKVEIFESENKALVYGRRKARDGGRKSQFAQSY